MIERSGLKRFWVNTPAVDRVADWGSARFHGLLQRLDAPKQVIGRMVLAWLQVRPPRPALPGVGRSRRGNCAFGRLR
jgi:hypothetical protein